MQKGQIIILILCGKTFVRISVNAGELKLATFTHVNTQVYHIFMI